MALKPMPMTPGTKPDPKHETTYQGSRGGHYKPPQQPPTTNAPKSNG